MLTNQELVELWSNDQKRRAFAQDFKAWGVWFTQPELDLTFYKYDLPDFSRLIALEYLRASYPSERNGGSGDAITCNKFYLQRGAYFNPFAVSGYEIANHLKNLKGKLIKEMNPNAPSDNE